MTFPATPVYPVLEADHQGTRLIAQDVTSTVSGRLSLEARLSTADGSLATRVSTEESVRGSQAVSLTTRVSTADSAAVSLTSRVSFEESTRASAVTSLDARFSTSGFTAEGGLTTTLLNKTGNASVKGSVVVVSATTDLAFTLAAANAVDPIGVVYDAGVADGQPCRIITSGIAEVLVEAGDSIVRDYWLRTPTATAGRGSLSATKGGGSVAEHFMEAGHCLESKANGGSTLAKCVIHFN